MEEEGFGGWGGGGGGVRVRGSCGGAKEPGAGAEVADEGLHCVCGGGDAGWRAVSGGGPEVKEG